MASGNDAGEDLLFLAMLATSVVDALMAISEGKSAGEEVLGRAREIVTAVKEKSYYALLDTAFPTSERQLRTITEVWSPAQLEDASRGIESVLRAPNGADDVEHLMDLFASLERRALLYLGERPMIEAAAFLV